MQVMALIYGDRSRWESMTDEERRAAYAEYTAFAEAAGVAGVLGGGAELSSTRDATTVRVRDAQTVVTDGPYAEAKEALGGYFLLEVPTLDDAVAWAARIPGAAHGAVEIRAVHRDPEEAQL
jgi:hypothetical protein